MTSSLVGISRNVGIADTRRLVWWRVLVGLEWCCRATNLFRCRRQARTAESDATGVEYPNSLINLLAIETFKCIENVLYCVAQLHVYTATRKEACEATDCFYTRNYSVYILVKVITQLRIIVFFFSPLFGWFFRSHQNPSSIESSVLQLPTRLPGVPPPPPRAPDRLPPLQGRRWHGQQQPCAGRVQARL